MALSETQKVTIEQSIAHLINPPESLSEFQEYEKNLFNVFTGVATTNEELQQLWNCFDDPTKYFKNLEHLGAEITIGEVKIYTLEYITKILNEKNFTISTWQPQQIIATAQNESDWKETFVTTHESPQDDYNPWILSTSDDMIFSGFVGHDEGSIIDDDTQEVLKILWPYVKIKLSLPDAEVTTKKLRFDSPVMQADFGVTIDQETYTRSTMTSAYSMAALHACSIALEYAATKGVEITPLNDVANQQSGYLEISSATCILLTKKYYLTQLINHTVSYAQLSKVHIDQSFILMKEALINCAESHLPGLSLNELLTYSPQLLSTLASQNVLGLMKNAKLTIEDVKKLTADHLKIIGLPLYFNKIMEGELTIEKILTLNHDETTMLLFPIVTNLIQGKKLTCKDVLQWPPHLKSFIADARFGELISHNLDDLQTLEHLDQAHIHFLQIKPIYTKYISGEISLEKISDLTDAKLNLLSSCPLLTKWLETNILSYEEVCSIPMSEPWHFYVRGMINSLFNVIHTQQNTAQQDEIWIKDLEVASQACQLELNSFIATFAYHLAIDSREFLNQSVADIDTAKLDPWLLRLNVLLNSEIDQKNTAWVSFYDEAAQYAHMILQKMRANRFIEETQSATNHAANTMFFVKQDKNPNSRISIRLQLICDTLEKMAHLTAAIIHHSADQTYKLRA